MTRNLKLIIEYDGTNYHGWQRQGKLPTIQLALERALKKLREKRPADKRGANGCRSACPRAGGQFLYGLETACLNLLRGMNSLLPDDIVIKDLAEVTTEFHSRYSAISKQYFYQVYNSSTASALWRNFSWHIHAKLDIIAMNEGADHLLGTHDFTSFCAAGHEIKKFSREVTSAVFTRHADTLRFSIEANGFLKYMVRNIVGTLIYVGMGKFRPDMIAQIISAKDRTLAGPTAPPQGLFLASVKYPGLA